MNPRSAQAPASAPTAPFAGTATDFSALDFSAAEEAAMDAALAAALGGIRGANPLVGAAVLDRDGTILAVGRHRGAGTPHAEADALAALGTGRDLSEGTMVVTLEPCAHHGRTGPCARAIVDAGVGRVVYAMDDPNPRAGGGAEILRAGGVDVRSGLRADASRHLNSRWLAAAREGRPFVTARLAQTLDGRIAAADGTSQWITCAASRADSHALRRRADAIVVGTGTVAADNPRLTARKTDGTPARKQPLRVAMGTRDIPADAAIRGATENGFVQILSHDPAAVLADLHRRGAHHVMIEGGGTISAAFLAAGLVDQLVIYLAPTLLGSGLAAVADLGIPTLSGALHWTWDPVGDGPVQTLGTDVKLTLLPAGPDTENLPTESTQGR